MFLIGNLNLFSGQDRQSAKTKIIRDTPEKEQIEQKNEPKCEIRKSK